MPLLEPQGRGARLTEAGRILARRTAEVLSTLAQAEAEIASLQSEVTGRVRIGALVSPSRTVLREPSPRSGTRTRQLEITFNEGESEELLPALIRRDLDVVVVDSWSTLPVELPDGVSFTPVYDDVALLALPASHPLAENKVVALSELPEHAWATWTRRNGFYTFTVRTLQREGFDPSNRVRGRRVSYRGEFVAQGRAVALIPRLARVVPPEAFECSTPFRRWASALPRPADRQRKTCSSWRRYEALRRQFDAIGDKTN